MLKSIVQLVSSLSEDNRKKDEEIKMLKQKLQYRHTEINDLRYKTRQLEKKVTEYENELSDGAGVPPDFRMSA